MLNNKLQCSPRKPTKAYTTTKEFVILFLLNVVVVYQDKAGKFLVVDCKVKESFSHRA